MRIATRAITTVVIATLFLAGCGAAELDVAPPPSKPVKLYSVDATSLAKSQSLPAVVRSIRSTDLAFQVGGQIVVWNALDGNEFRKGQVIGQLDPRSFRNAVTQAEAQFRNADGEYQRAKRLIEQDAISQSVVESRLAQRDIAQAALDDARKRLADATLRAPFSGFVGKTYVEQFQNIGAQAPVLTMQSSDVEVVVNVPGSFVLNSNRLNISEVYVELDAAPGRRFPARFRDATGQADQSTQTFEGRFEFSPPADLTVLSGMTATLFFDLEDAVEGSPSDEGVTIPLASIITEGPKRFVWVVKPNERTVSRREVTVADEVGAMTTVTSGIRPGETIVAAGGAYLSEGDKVRAWRSAAR